jgi:hypothetical protein
MYVTIGIIAALFLLIIAFFLRKIAIQNAYIEDLMNEVAFERYHSEAVLELYADLHTQYEILNDQYQMFIEVQQQPLAN